MDWKTTGKDKYFTKVVIFGCLQGYLGVEAVVLTFGVFEKSSVTNVESRLNRFKNQFLRLYNVGFICVFVFVTLRYVFFKFIDIS